MLNDRQKSILDIIDEQGDVTLNELSQAFSDVSVMTLRRDLLQLEQLGHVLRNKGGAVSLKKLTEYSQIPGEENEYGLRARANIASKKIIAEKALKLVRKGCSIYLDAGSTIMALARMLPNEHFNIITNATNVAQELIERTNTSVVILGGNLNRNTLSVSGPSAIKSIDRINIEMAFMSASAFTLETGFTVSNVYESELKRKVISKAKKRIMLMDSSKIGKDLMYTLAELNDIDVLITELDNLPADIKKAAKAKNIEIL
ncbi:MAG: DeoR/GlpR transcriptional regulator [Ruminococcaceae bacterium]|nr:DeoR/GlpR transcriptional regulator [Oscillospiraceae bacterium]